VFKRIVSLPLFPRMQDSDVLRVTRQVREILDSLRRNRAVNQRSIQPGSARLG
jgi:hypothetical protein